MSTPAPTPPAQPSARRRIAASSSLWEWCKLAAPTLLLIAAAFAVAWQFVEPAPPRTVTIATGSEAGSYHQAALQYVPIFERAGIELRLRPTAGSIENLQLLAASAAGTSEPDAAIDLAIIQGGTAPDDADDHGLEAVAAIYYEPLWIIHHASLDADDLPDLRGRRIAVGPEGSGLRALALQLLAANAMHDGDEAATTLLPLAGDTAIAALQAGEIDALMLVTAPDNPRLGDLLAEPGLRLLSLRRAEAYARRFPFLSHVVAYEGSLDLARNLPAHNTHLVAPAAYLAAHHDTHRAVVQLLVQCAKDAHAANGMLAPRGTFPTDQFTDLPVSREAQYHLTHGPNFLQRHLPFWLASLISRTVILLVPLLFVLIPLIRMLPPVYRWRIRSRIYRWYTQLRRIDEHLRDADQKPDIAAALAEDRARINRLEHDIASVKVPLSYMEEFYNLRLHLAYIRGRIEAHQQFAAAQDADRTAPADHQT